MMERLPAASFLAVIYVFCCLATFANSVTSPPRIADQKDREIAYILQKEVTLPCIAFGDPTPTLRWEKDGIPIIIDSQTPNLELKSGRGLVLHKPTDTDAGGYQCFAQNEFGTAVGVKMQLRQAAMGSFPHTSDEPLVHRPMVGEPLTLQCNPPYSYPKGVFYWAELKEDEKFSSIDMNERISTDYDGNLHFANILDVDSRENRYVCIGQNSVLRSLARSDDEKILAVPRSGEIPEKAPQLVWPSSGDNSVTVLKGETLRLKCIFSGYPTPVVQWSRLASDAGFPTKVTHNLQEIIVPDIDFTDKGTYECSATNSATATPVTQTFDVLVQSMPFWKTKPKNVNTAEEEDAEFICEAGGVPRPQITWSVNGIPIDELEENPRQQVHENRVFYKNLTTVDVQVLQCNASNKHGYIFTNAFLNVLAEPPSFVELPEAIVKVALAHDVTLKCRVFGAPKPTVIWKKGGVDISNTRITKQDNDDLLIRSVEKADEGIYECRAWNKFGEEGASSELNVRERTTISVGPKPQERVAGSKVKFRCRAHTDPLEAKRLEVTWLRDGKTILFEHEPRMQKMPDNALVLHRVTVEDSADYTCVASNGVDVERVTAHLLVKDRPDAPTNVRLHGCMSTRASITWSPGRDNNDAITEYLVYYNTSFDEPGVYHNAAVRVRDDYTRDIRLSPWANYTFHVRARNGVGLSARSNLTQARCLTDPNIPSKNPKGVCVESRDPRHLVIVWTRMPRIEHNGENFHYIVRYRRADQPDLAFTEQIVHNWRQTELVVDVDDVYTKFVFSVQAANDKGQLPRSRVRWHEGFSGEDKPLAVPQNFALKEGSLNATSGIFAWDPVDRSVESIRGFFKGYQIQFWKSRQPDQSFTEYVILENYKPCKLHKVDAPSGGGEARLRREVQQVEKRVVSLWPYTDISAAVQVLTGGGQGDLSSHIQFQTPEGVPGPVDSLTVTEHGSHHLRLAWRKPDRVNGHLTGFSISYIEKQNFEAIFIDVMLPAHRRTHVIKDLVPDTIYLLLFFAHTNAGRGEEYELETTTELDSAPDVPYLIQPVSEDNYVNVTWKSTDPDEDPVNPGCLFYVEYRYANDDNDRWSRTHRTEHYWENISDLAYNQVYEMRVVALTGDEKKASRSAIKEVQVGVLGGSVQQNIASSAWFIGLLIAIILLILIIIICCLIKRNRGGKYPVHEKEKLRGNNPEKEADLPFGEFTKSDEPEHKKSMGSLESEGKPLESDMESLAEYYDLDNAKFDEEGSFIGVYGAKKRPEEKPLMNSNETSTPLSSFV